MYNLYLLLPDPVAESAGDLSSVVAELSERSLFLGTLIKKIKIVINIHVIS